MKKHFLTAGLMSLGVLAAFVELGDSASATTSGIASKTTMITIVVTPSPAPVGYLLDEPRGTADASSFDWGVARFARFVRGVGSAFFGAGSTVGGGSIVAVTQTPVPVAITVKPDPTSQFLHVNNPTPGQPAVFNAQYGPNTLACAYQVYAFFGTKLGTNTVKNYTLYDYVYGSAYGAGGTFPSWDGPTVSDLSWALDGAAAPGPYVMGSTFTPFYNSGSTGQLTYTGVPGAAATLCVDLSLNVPNTVAAGTYTVPITYSLQITY